MSNETKIEFEGVAAFITQSTGRVLTIEELRTKRSTNKIGGMRSIPMETVEPGEEHEDALKRLITEEITIFGFIPVRLDRIPICHFRPLDHIRVHTYLLEIPEACEIDLGTHKEEVSDPKWELISKLIFQREDARFYRGGNRESAVSYMRYLAGHNNLPDVYETVRDRISDSVFDEIEISQNRVLFPANHYAPL